MKTKPCTIKQKSFLDSIFWPGVALLSYSFWWIGNPYYPISGGNEFGLCLSVLALGLVFSSLLGRHSVKKSFVVVLALIFSGVAGIFCFQVVELYGDGSIPGVARLSEYVLKLFGSNSECGGGGQILISADSGILRILPTWSILCVRAFIVALTGLLVICLARGRKDWRKCLFSGIALLLIGMVVFWIKCLEYESIPKPLEAVHPSNLSLFWKPWELGLGLLLWGFIANKIMGGCPQFSEESTRLTKRQVTLTVFSGLILGGSIALENPGREKAGRVLIDDRLSGVWEPAARLLTKDRFGDFSTYSFSALTESLSHRFAVSVNTGQEYSAGFLSNYDVLVIKTPEEYPSVKEVESIRLWVEAGGGLFVIGDHTDLMGMGGILNSLIRGTGIEFQFDSTSESAGGGFDYWKPSHLTSHSITKGLDEIQMMTPCSISISEAAEPILVLNHSTSREGDYSRGSNFGLKEPMPSVSQGRKIVCAAAPFGKGRVLAFSDSTIFSSFASPSWGRQKFLFNCVAWLNRSSTPWFRIYSVVMMLAGLGFVFFILRGGHGFIAQLPLLFLAMGLGIFATGSVGSSIPIVPEPKKGTSRVGVMNTGGYAWLPAVLGNQSSPPEGGNLSTFLSVPQRVGCEVTVITPNEHELQLLEGLFILNPESGKEVLETLPEEWFVEVERWVKAGGVLLVTSRSQHKGHSHDLSNLYHFGLNLGSVPSPDERIDIMVGILGKGKIIQLTGSEAFDLESMGHCMSWPLPSQRRVYEAIYYVLEEIAFLAPSERRTYQIIR